jgi:hypothetical protein
MSAAALLDRLEAVRANGPGRWVARCPAHEDRSPSLSIREVEDRTLVYCFAGCEVHDVLAAVGLTVADLFEKPLDHHRGPVRDRRHQHAAGEALKLLSHESLVALVAAENISRGIDLGDDGRARLAVAATRIRAAREAAA